MHVVMSDWSLTNGHGSGVNISLTNPASLPESAVSTAGHATAGGGDTVELWIEIGGMSRHWCGRVVLLA